VLRRAALRLPRTGLLGMIDFFAPWPVSQDRLDGAPRSLGDVVILGASLAIHSDPELGGQPAVEILRAVEVTAVVAVPDMGQLAARCPPLR
jgi:hypothetical protein